MGDLFPKGTPFLLACSGGLDSMSLAFIFKKLDIQFRLVHINYGLREEQSDLDEELVRRWSKEKSISLEIGNAKNDMLLAKGNVQHRARNWRYSFFKAIQKENEVLVSAHHQDDLVEGYFISLSRKEKWEAMSGMEVWNGVVYRPLLPFSKNEIKSFASGSSISWREDASNQSEKYLRNRIRNKLIPNLDLFSSEWRSDILAIQTLLQTLKTHKNRGLEEWKSSFVEQSANEIKIRPNAFDAPYFAFAVAYLRSFGKLDLIGLKQIIGRAGKFLKIGNYRLEVDPAYFFLVEDNAEHSEELLFQLGNQKLDATHFVSSSSMGPNVQVKKSNALAYLDSNKLKEPLKWRHPLNGDRFFPMGMSGSKKISDFLNEKALSRTEKKKIWLLTSNNEIVWIAGYRIDRRFVANDQTSEAYFVRLTQEVIQ